MAMSGLPPPLPPSFCATELTSSPALTRSVRSRLTPAASWTRPSALTAARTAVGEGQTLLAYSSLQKKLAEELPYISIAYRNQAVFASKNIGGEVHPVESNVFRGIEAWTYQKGE